MSALAATPDPYCPRRPVSNFSALELRVMAYAAGRSALGPSMPPRAALWHRLSTRFLPPAVTAPFADLRLEALRGYASAVHQSGRPQQLAARAQFLAAGYTADQAHYVEEIAAPPAPPVIPDRQHLRHQHAARERKIYTGGVALGLAAISGMVALAGVMMTVR